MPRIQEHLREKKPFTRIAYVDGNEMKFIITSGLKIDGGFLNVSPDDFAYTVEPSEDPKAKAVNINGANPRSNKYINSLKVDQYEIINPEDSRYATYVDIVERATAENCKIQLTPKKEILIP